jgi:6-pyruvoyltetrahydropterin/6-carboxytetrahydropterin synthase
MHARLTRSFSFEAAHWLPQVPEGHKCRRMHGHAYSVCLGIEGEVDPKLGWVLDYGEITAKCQPLRRLLDHACLNEIEGLENPTAENLAAWIFERLKPELPLLTDVTIQETPASAATYRPPTP